MNVLILRDGMEPYQFAEAVLSGQDMPNMTVLPIPPSMDEKQGEALRQLIQKYEGPPGVAFVTSGTVGTSKVVVRPYEGIVAESEDVAFATRMSANSRTLITTPITHSFGFGIVMAAVLSGGKVDVASSPYVHERSSLARMYLNTNEYDIMTGVPFMFRMLVHNPARRVAKRNYAGGEVLSLRLVNEFKKMYDKRLLQEYGLSELGIVTFSDETDPWDSIGFPIPRTKVSWDGAELILDRPGRPFCYLSENGQTAEQDIFTSHGVRTGDLGHEVDGILFLSGRAKNILKIAGKAVACEEIEASLMAHPLVREAIVIGKPHDIRGEVAHAYVTPELSPQDEADVLFWMATQIQKYKLPYTLTSMPEFPRLGTSGKVDRQALR